MSVDNLRRVANQASPEERKYALDSFFKYRRITADIAQKYGFAAEVGAAVFAALSPSNDYFGNLRDCDSLLQAAKNGMGMGSFRVSTYGPNKEKAWEIAHGANPLELIVAKKTRSFFLNIKDPTDPIPVTIDGHMFNCWRNERAGLVNLKTSDREYDVIAEGVRQLASEDGIIPSQMQGIIWITHRRLLRRSKLQLELWDPDYIAARLGFRVGI